MPIVKFVFELYLIILLLRFFLRLFGAHSLNPVYLWIIKLSSFVVRPVEKMLPTHGQFSWACLLVILIIKVIELLLIIYVQINMWPHMGGVIIIAIGQLLYLSANIFFFAIILQAILSWVAYIQRRYFSLQEPLAALTDPLLTPVRRIIPTFGGIDISAIPVLILLQLCQTYLILPIINVGIQLILP